MSDEIWQRDDNWVGSEIDDQFVMVNIDTGTYVALNASANDVWQLLEQPRSKAEIEQGLQARYAVDPATCAASVSRVLDQMRELQLAAPR